MSLKDVYLVRRGCVALCVVRTDLRVLTEGTKGEINEAAAQTATATMSNTGKQLICASNNNVCQLFTFEDHLRLIFHTEVCVK